MSLKTNAILIADNDDVATGIVAFAKGEVGRYIKDGKIREVILTEDIPKFHKFAVRDINKSEFVCKYGEIIGEAIADINKGSYVHDHNICSPKVR